MKNLSILLAIIFCCSISYAEDLNQCIQSCNDKYPTVVTTKVFSDNIIFEDTSSLGSGEYKGTAVILFPTKWENQILSVIVNGETSLHDVSYKGQPVFRLLKKGWEYTRPLRFIIETNYTIYTYNLGSTQVDTSGSWTTGSSKRILWKPISDNDKKLAVLLDSSMGKPNIRILTMDFKVLDSGKFTAFSNPNRATYRFGKSGREYLTPCLLQVGDSFYKVTDPSKRLETLPSYIKK